MQRSGVLRALCLCLTAVGSSAEAALPLPLTEPESTGSSSSRVAPSVDLPARRAAIALHLLIDEDTTGLAGVLAVRISEVLAQSPDAQTRQTLLGDVRTLLQRAREAKSPSQLLEVLDSPEGRRQALFSRMPPWDPVRRSFTSGFDDPLAGPPAVLQLRQKLLSRGSLAESDLIPIVAALAGRPETPDLVQRVFDDVPPDQRETIGRLVAAFTDEGTNADDVRRLSKGVVDLATSEIASRSATLRSLNARSGPAAWTGDIDGLPRGDVT